MPTLVINSKLFMVGVFHMKPFANMIGDEKHLCLESDVIVFLFLVLKS